MRDLHLDIVEPEIAEHPAVIGDLVIWRKRTGDHDAWFAAFVHGVDARGYVTLANFRGRIREMEELGARGAENWWVVPRNVITNERALDHAVATSWATREALAAHLKNSAPTSLTEEIRRTYHKRRVSFRKALAKSLSEQKTEGAGK